MICGRRRESDLILTEKSRAAGWGEDSESLEGCVKGSVLGNHQSDINSDSPSSSDQL